MEGHALLSLVIRLAFAIFLTALLASSIKDALNKYLDQPVQSSVSFRLGDDNHGRVRLPVLTICRPGFIDESRGFKPVWNNAGSKRACAQNRKWPMLLDYLEHCLLNELYMTVHTLLQEIRHGLHDIIHEIQSFDIPKISDKSSWIKFKDMIIGEFFDLTWGHCLSINVSNLVPGGLVQINNPWGKTNLNIRLNLDPEKGDVDQLKMFVHSGEHFYHINDYFPSIYFTNLGQYRILVEKKVIQTLPNARTACTDNPIWTCTINSLIRRTKKTYNCSIAFLYQDSQIQQEVGDIPACSSNVTLKIVQTLIEILSMKRFPREFGCKKVMPCKQTKYLVSLTESRMEANISRVWIRMTFDNPMVEHVIDSYSYNLHSFLGECGGTMGLLLGFSCLEMFNLILKYLMGSTSKVLSCLLI